LKGSPAERVNLKKGEKRRNRERKRGRKRKRKAENGTAPWRRVYRKLRRQVEEKGEKPDSRERDWSVGREKGTLDSCFRAWLRFQIRSGKERGCGGKKN